MRKKFGIAFGILFILMISASTKVHDFHIALCDINQNIYNNNIEIAFKVFTDDLELALNNEKDSVAFKFTDDPYFGDSLVNNYLQQKLVFTINGKQKVMKYIGKEMENDGTWCYLEIQEKDSLQSLEVYCSVFMELFDDQNHIIKVKSYSIEKSLLLTKDLNRDKIIFTQ